MKLRKLPNALSISRILLCIGIIISAIYGEIFSWTTIIIFVVAGITDMLDGPLARRIKDGRTELGATLDSIADLVMIIVSIIVFIPAMGLWGYLVVLYFMAITFKVIVPSLIGVLKHKEFISLHTYTFKTLVGFLFSIPILFFILQELDIAAVSFMNVYALVIAISAYVFIAEEIVIILATNRPSRDIKSIFHIKKFNEYEGGEKISIKK